MKKIIITLALSAGIFANNAPLNAGATAQKVGASTKIICGILGLPVSVFLAYKGLTLQVLVTKSTFNGSTTYNAPQRAAHRLHNLLGAVSILPLSIIAIESGIKDLQNIENENISI